MKEKIIGSNTTYQKNWLLMFTTLKNDQHFGHDERPKSWFRRSMRVQLSITMDSVKGMMASIKGLDTVSMLLELQLMTLVQNQHYINAIYYAHRYIRELNNVGKDVTLMAIFHVINKRVVAKKHIAICLQLYKQIPVTLYSHAKVQKLMINCQFCNH